MEVAALLISIAAVLLAAWGAFSARRSAKAAEDARDIAKGSHALDEERRWEELTPRFKVEFVQVEDAAPALRFTSEGPEDYDTVTYALADQHPRVLLGVVAPETGGDQPRPLGSLGAFGAGEEKVFAVDRAGDVGGIVRVRLQVFDRRARSWEVLVECEIPGVPKVRFVSG